MEMQRIYSQIVESHLAENRQMVFLMGPRQVGKTTLALMSGTKESTFYFNWDDIEDRERIVKGPAAILERAPLAQLREELPLLIFDEIHRYSRWKTFLKGFFDKQQKRCRIIVTGSSRLDIFQRGGDSLMGRYFPYRMHPLSVAEVVGSPLREEEVCRTPKPIGRQALQNLLGCGGFPEPFLKGTARFYNRWSRLRREQLFRDDIRDLTRVQELGQMEVLAELIRQQVGGQTRYTSLAGDVRVSVDTIRRWMDILAAVYYAYPVRPWWKNVARSLRKEPKFYLWDWALCPDEGSRFENFVASHLLKAVHLWSDYGLGSYGLHYLRDKEKREVDFLVSREGKPWFLVEVKRSRGQKLSPHLDYFLKQTGAQHAFQVVLDLPFVQKDCFQVAEPTIVPAKTFLAQLV